MIGGYIKGIVAFVRFFRIQYVYLGIFSECLQGTYYGPVDV